MVKYTIEQLEAMSDRELGVLVTNKAYGENQWDIVDINSWADMEPIAQANGIDLMVVDSSGRHIEGVILARSVENRLFKRHKKPLRTAAIVYLLMD